MYIIYIYICIYIYITNHHISDHFGTKKRKHDNTWHHQTIGAGEALATLRRGFGGAPLGSRAASVM